MTSFLTACLYISDEDIKIKAKELGYDHLSQSDLNKIKGHLRLIAQAWASATLQDAQQRDFEDWLSEDKDE